MKIFLDKFQRVFTLPFVQYWNKIQIRPTIWNKMWWTPITCVNVLLSVLRLTSSQLKSWVYRYIDLNFLTDCTTFIKHFAKGTKTTLCLPCDATYSSLKPFTLLMPRLLDLYGERQCTLAAVLWSCTHGRPGLRRLRWCGWERNPTKLSRPDLSGIRYVNKMLIQGCQQPGIMRELL